MHQTIIAFCGYAGSGKTTSAKVLVDELAFVRLPLAGPLKRMMASIGLSEEQIHGDLKETPCDLLCGKTPRYAMQTVGTEWGREIIGSDIWTNAWKESAWSALEYGDASGVVCDDCRFENEVEAIRDLGGYVVHVHRLGVSAESAHRSEAMPGVPDFEIHNIGSVEDLRRQVLALPPLTR